MPDVVPANTDSHIACRHNCAYNLPAMTTFCSTAGKVDNFIQHLYSTFQNLACDPYFVIRQTVACSLYEVMVVFYFDLNSTVTESEAHMYMIFYYCPVSEPCHRHFCSHSLFIQGMAERSSLFGKQINSKPGSSFCRTCISVVMYLELHGQWCNFCEPRYSRNMYIIINKLV